MQEIAAMVKLSDTELAIVKELAEGLSSQEIADKRGVAFKTIEVHRHNVLKKTGCKNSVHLITTLFRKKVLS